MQTDKYYLCKDLIGNIDSLTSSAKQTIDSIEAYNENSKTGATAKFSIYANGNTTSTALDADETLQIVMQNHTFEPGEYEVGEYSSAYFNYVHIRNYHALKSPIAEIEKKYKDCDQMERLHEVCMNVSGDNPWKVIDDLKWFAQTDFLADAIAVFEKHRDEQILDEWLKTHDGEDYCEYCPKNAECPHGMACYGGEPIEPPCSGADMKEFLYTDSIIEDALEERYGEE